MNFIFILILILSLAPKQLLAEEDKPSLPAVLKADKVDGDQVNNIINAIGNVELTKNGKIVFSNKMSYDKNSGYIKALGDVVIIDHEMGNVLADYADVKDDMSKGQFTDATLIFQNGSYIKSPEIVRKSKEETIVKKGIFSICPNPDIAKDNKKAGKKRDFISVKSKTTNIDRKEEKVKSKHGVLRLYDMPIFYTPYLSFPMTESERKSGFLTPSYVSSTKLDTGLVIPYYFNIAPNKDLVSSFQFHPSEGHLLLNNHYRHLLKNGYYESRLEFANNEIDTNGVDNTGDVKQINDDLRWHLKSGGNFILSKNVGLEFDIDNVGDKDYLEDYHNLFINNTVSDITLDYIKGRNYHYIKTVRIQEIENDSQKDGAPFALPIINSYIESKSGSFNQKYSLLSNLTALQRRDGLQYRRATFKPQITVPYNVAGHLFEAQANIQGDFYNIENNYKDSSQNDNLSSSEFNYRPEASLNWSFPLAKYLKSGSLVIEPMANFVVSAYDKDFNAIPNEDSQNVELTESNLFLSDRFVGFDRNETGSRVNYGVKSALYNNLGRFRFSLGQGYREGNKDQDVGIIGFNSKHSNLIGNLAYSAPKYFNFNYNFQLNESNYDNEINQLSAGLNFERFKLNGSYILTKGSASNNLEREQYNLRSVINFTDKITGNAGVIYDLIEERAIMKNFGIVYNGCCVMVGLHMTEYNPSNFIQSEVSYRIQFTIKNLM